MVNGQWSMVDGRAARRLTGMAAILVVDDDPVVRQLIRTALQMSDYKVEEAGDGLEGIHCCASRHFDLVILDLMMPNKDGLQMISDLTFTDPAISILAISGWIDDKVDLLDAAAKLGADDTLQKPFDVQVLLSKVETLLAEPLQP
jgi:DNA-binding response OmpR family regulator